MLVTVPDAHYTLCRLELFFQGDIVKHREECRVLLCPLVDRGQQRSCDSWHLEAVEQTGKPALLPR